MSIIHIKVICLVLLCKVLLEVLSWDSSFVHPCYFQVGIYEAQKFKDVAVLHHHKAMAALNPTKKVMKARLVLFQLFYYDYH